MHAARAASRLGDVVIVLVSGLPLGDVWEEGGGETQVCGWVGVWGGTHVCG